MEKKLEFNSTDEYIKKNNKAHIVYVRNLCTCVHAYVCVHTRYIHLYTFTCMGIGVDVKNIYLLNLAYFRTTKMARALSNNFVRSMGVAQ